MSLVRGLLGSLVVVAAAGCGLTEPPGTPEEGWAWASLGRPCPATEVARSLSPIARDSLTSPVAVTVDDRWAAIARRVPGGWGGFFYESGRPTIYLVDPTQRDAAYAALQAEGIPAMSAHVKTGHWDFAQMYDWYRYLSPHIWSIEGVHQSDIQESANRLEYTVLDQATRDEVDRVLTELMIPCFLVATRVGPMAVAN